MIAQDKPDPQTPSSPDDDPVWSLLEHASPRTRADATFCQRTLAAAAACPQNQRLRRHRFTQPLRLAAAAAILAAALALHFHHSSALAPQNPRTQEAAASAQSELEELAATETLLAAVEHIDLLSDAELAELLGF